MKENLSVTLNFNYNSLKALIIVTPNGFLEVVIVFMGKNIDVFIV